MQEVILNTLNSNDNIKNIIDNSFLRIYHNKSYKYILKFTFKVANLDVPIVMGVPNDWDMKLIDVYIENYQEIKYIPHIGGDGKVCLFDLEGVLIDKNFEGLLNQTIDRLYDTLYKGLNRLNREDFIEEFEEYWGQIPNAKPLKSMIAITKETKLIKYSDNQNEPKRRKHDQYIDMLRKNNSYSLVSSDNEQDFKFYKDMNVIKNGVYIYIDADSYIYPPDWRNKLNIEYINTLINHISINKDKLLFNINKCNGDLVLIFNIKQPNSCVSTLGVIIKRYTITTNQNEIKLFSQFEIIPCRVMRCDREFLLNRGGANTYLSSKKILVIGCGSIGGYLINELIKTGINNICVVDSDIMKEENIYRHLLGMEYVGEYKSKAIVDYISKNVPQVDIKSHEENIEDVVGDESISFSEYDLIISAVGNHNLNRWINEYVHRNSINTPMVYLWNETLGIGNHVAFISTENEGCYECLFGYNEDGIYDKTSYCERGQSFTKRIRGCGSAYMPFSSVNSETTVITGIEVIRRYFEGKVDKNILVSVKGDDYYFCNVGLRPSNRYIKQRETKVGIEGDKFKNSCCLICEEK